MGRLLSNLTLRLLMATGLVFTFVGVSAEIYYVTPTPSTPCPQEGEPCFTLSQYASKPEDYFPINATIMISLLPGNHNLDSHLWISNVTSLTIFAVSHSDTTITCSESAMFTFERIGVVIISRLLFLGCENSRVISVSHLMLEDCSLQGLYRSGAGLELCHAISANIVRSMFSSFKTGAELELSSGFPDIRGGAAILVRYSESVNISNSAFVNNTLTGKNAVGGAVAALFSNITISGSTFTNNAVTAHKGVGGAVGVLYGSTLTLNSSVFINNTVTGEYGIGGAVGTLSSRSGALSRSRISIDYSTFHNNNVIGNHGLGGAVATDLFGIAVTINSSTFINNAVVGHNGIGGVLFALFSTITLNFSRFINNSVSGDGGAGGAVSAVLSSATAVCSTFTNNTVAGGNVTGGAIHAINSSIAVHSSKLISNKAVMGDNVIQGEALSHTLSPGYSSETSNSSGLINNIGGALFALYSTTTINFSLFNDNIVIGQFGSGGAVYTLNSATTIDSSMFTNNTVSGISALGGAICSFSVGRGEFYSITVSNCTFTNNVVVAEGTAALFPSTSSQNSSSFLSIQLDKANTAAGGAVCTFMSTLTIVNNSTFAYNSVTGGRGLGGAVAAYLGSTLIDQSTFTSNTATGMYGGAGGAVCAVNGTTSVNRSMFTINGVTGNDVGVGGALCSAVSKTALNSTSFASNTVTGDTGQGGAVYYVGEKMHCRNISTYDCAFTNNSVTGSGGALYLGTSNLNSTRFLIIKHNKAHRGALYAIHGTVHISGSITISNNRGSLFASSCTMTLMGYTNIMNNSILSNTSQEAGAVTAFLSEITLVGTTRLMFNTAMRGGAVSATESKVYLHGNTAIAYNTASVSGGGINAYQSELTFEGNVSISRNIAADKGGGIHAISSTVRLMDGSKTLFTSNHAERGGGGVCLEFNAKLYVIKSKTECNRYKIRCAASHDAHFLAELDCSRFDICDDDPESWLRLDFTENSAVYGGALYVTDETNSGVCYAIPFADEPTISSECFLQALGVYYQFKSSSLNLFGIELDDWFLFMNTLNIHFSNNSARVAGGILYGGLLDRCTVSPFAELFAKYTNFTPSSLDGTSYILNVTNIQLEDLTLPQMVSSNAVRVCFCSSGQPDCSYHPRPRYVKKGETFTVPLVAVDQVNNTIANVSVHSFLSLQASLGEKQSIQQTSLNGSCSDMVYNVFSPQDSEQLQLYASGPCAGIGISKASLVVNILPCPIGFKDANLSCECDPDLYPQYISGCSIDKDSVIRKESVWFTFVNATDYHGYMYHQQCPFDYCRPPDEEILVNLSMIPNGSDAICAFDHSGKLCGSCKDGLSLSLGSSRCMPCSNNWLALLFVFALAGIALVAFLLWCNLTVPYGTINGLIFYANIFAANRAVFFPFHKPRALAVFVAWLNLDFGFESCFYNGMDTYVKTWLQLVFPLYIIALVIAIIAISGYSPRFASLFTGKNPVATLATLILLSYTKLLRTIITSLSFATLEYSDGSRELVWLADGNVPYLKGKHIPLFVTALVILLVGITYTSVLFGWQWLMYCPKRKPLTWMFRNTKVTAFIDAYHNPFNIHHRYWIGLLLLVRALLYLVFAVNVLGDPRINLLTIISTMVILLFFQRAVGYKHKIHKKWHSFTFESISFLNLIGLSSVTFYITEDTKSQMVVAYFSSAVTFTTFLVVIVCHCYVFVFKSTFKNAITKFLNRIRRPSNYLPLSNETVTCALEEDSVTVTEIDGFPEPVDTEIDDTLIANESVTVEEGEETETPSGSADSEPDSFYFVDLSTVQGDTSDNAVADIELHNLVSECPPPTVGDTPQFMQSANETPREIDAKSNKHLV